ncbi:MAG: DNA-directed RNA polymerase subunit B, partial [Candidatus Micrarchaeota archaeon]
MDKASVYLNGRFVGFVEDGGKLAKELREKRRAGELDVQMNVAHYERTREVFINTDSGRARRPLIVVKNNKPVLTEKHVEEIKGGSLKWSALTKQGAIEYLDAEEEENALVALDTEELESADKRGA